MPFHNVSRHQFLVLENLGLAERDKFFAMSQPRHFSSGKSIFSKGGPGETMMLIESGRVEVSLTTKVGKRVIVAHLGPGDSVGEMSVLLNSERIADAVATNDVTGRIVERKRLMDFLADNPQATLGFIKELCRKLQLTTEALADLTMTDGGARLAKVLCSQFHRWGVQEPDGLRLTLPVSQSDLGDMAGLTRETVNRHIRSWQRAGILRRDGRNLILVDSARLTNRAQSGRNQT